MAGGLGMRGKDLRVFCMIAQRFDVYLLVRQTNEASLPYVGRPGYYPKPAAIKAKTADQDPPPASFLVNGRSQTRVHRVAGLVAHPWFQPAAFGADRLAKARECWLETLDYALSPGANVPAADPANPATWPAWAKERVSARTGWRWRVDVDPGSAHFGCLQVARDAVPWSYLHGDYDLKDVIVRGHEAHNERVEGTVHGVKNYTPRLLGREFETIQRALNDAMGVEMVQHGAEAQFAWHGDEPITLILPEGPSLQFLILGNAEAVQRWYIDRNRRLIAQNGKNYLGDKSRWFWFGDHGNLFLPGTDRSV